MRAVAAVDLGATSGRVVLGHVAPDELHVRAVARFANEPVAVTEGVGSNLGEGLHWDVLGLHRSLTAGLAAALRDEPDLVSVGIDSWAVDYALLAGGRVTQMPYHYRDKRTAAGVAAVHAVVDAASLYERTGLQHLPFTTLFQLAVDRASGVLDRADRALMVPDLIAYWLTGEQATEVTNASTTGLLDPRTRRWDAELFARTGVPSSLFAPLVEPGQVTGGLTPAVARQLGAPSRLVVTTVGSHDTASAVVAVPAADDDVAYISSGTWSLVGVEIDRPVVTQEARVANFTNEGGVDGRVRFLKNVSGLWLLSESVRTWEREDGGRAVDLPALLAQAAAVSRPVAPFDPADQRFVTPGDMPARIASWYRERGLQEPRSRAEVVRAILESLAQAYAVTVQDAVRLSGRTVRALHVVGGGSQNALLCQLTADRTGLPVLAGPVEATAIGNVLVQARAHGLVTGSLESLRALVRRTFTPVRYEPRTAAAAASQKG
ncbi:rhamnulokinase [Frigoribacterium salinisoli]